MRNRATTTETRSPRLTVLYDADCGFCVCTARLLRRLDRARRLRLVPLQHAEAEIPDAPSQAELLATLHAVDDEGRWTRGGAAFLRIGDVVPALRWLGIVGRLPLVDRLVEPAYALVARNRPLLSRLFFPFGCARTSRRLA